MPRRVSHESRRSRDAWQRRTSTISLALLVTAVQLLAVDVVQSLELGRPLQREIGPGQNHPYRITLSQDQYAHIIVDQRGVDVVVDLFGPDGTKLTEVDGPDGTQGPESVSVIADVPGDYRINVRPSDPDAPPGPYEVRIVDLRAATPRDPDRVAAERHFANGQRIFDSNAEADRRKAIEEYKVAAGLWGGLNDRANEAMALHSLGFVNDSLSELKSAVEYYNQALSIRRERGDLVRAGKTLSSLGATYNSLGENGKALDCLKEALPLRRAAHDPLGEANTLNNLGSIYNDIGEAQQALDAYRQAMVLWRSLSDRGGESYTVAGLGLVYFYLGEPEQALDYFNEALRLSRAVKSHEQEGTWLTNIGRVYASSGENAKALQYFTDALPLRQEVGDRVGVAYTLNNIGAAYRDSNEPEKALGYYTQALQLRREIGDQRGEAESLHEIGSAYELLGEKDKAAEHYRQALAFRRAVGDQRAQASTLAGIARMERDRGNLNDALPLVEEALGIVENLRTKVVRQDLRASYFATTRRLYELDIDLLFRLYQLHPTGGYLERSFQVAERARARSLLEVLSEAKHNIREGVDPQLLLRERELEGALTGKTDYQIRLLSGKHNEDQAAATVREIEGILGELRGVETAVRTSSARYTALTSPEPLSVSDVQRQILDETTLLLEYFLGDERSYLWSVERGSISIFTLPRRADVERLARSFYDTLTSRNASVGIPAGARRITPTSPDAVTPSPGSALAKAILSPAERLLGTQRLAIVPDGILQYIPFAALPSMRGDTSVPLISQHEIVSLPSASTLGVLRRQTADRPQWPKTVAILADPVFSKDDSRLMAAKQTRVTASSDLALQRSIVDVEGELRLPRLPFTRAEAEGIEATVGRSGTMKALDFKANLITATSANLSGFGIVHFATHGLLDTVHPELSGLVLSLVGKDGRPENGFLKLQDIYNLKLSAGLVVLSACQTGLGKDIKGEGLVGLTRGFMYAGVPRVVASLWKVDDASTAEMMKRFYQAMIVDNMAPAAALRDAQLRVSRQKRWASPYYWAGFVLQGEWK